MLLQGGTTPRLRKSFNSLLQQNPSTVYLFPNYEGAFDDAVVKKSEQQSKVMFVNLCDPTPDNPWKMEDLKSFASYVHEAAEELKRGNTILIACVGGKNRSRALAKGAARIAKMQQLAAEIEEPDEVSLRNAYMAVNEKGGDDAELIKLAPLRPIRALRHRNLKRKQP